MIATDPPSQECWRLDALRAAFKCGDLAGVMDADRPDLGIQLIDPRCESNRDRLFCIGLGDLYADPCWTPVDVYARGRDLKVFYGESDQRPFGVAMQWSVAPVELVGGVVVDVVVSLQTSRQTAYVEVELGSTVDCASAATVSARETAVAEIARTDASIATAGDRPGSETLLLRLAGGKSYVEARVPEDFPTFGLFVEPPRRCRTTSRFPRILIEKGVIRRLRMRCAIVAQETEAAAAAMLRDGLIRADPPLTA